ncbi:hypothetical protein M0R45_002633 [Rubus argutus]|uniref:TIR domain-containing protein n=1 Tax=Rubus argutus TaxID=59490 RepID=A0AAW1VQZ4_RUBAR
MSRPASASLPSSSTGQWKYDVFLSFRGEDTRESIVSHIYYELQDASRIQTFMDDIRLEVGMPISPSLLKAIKESRLAIVVLSENYASSSWCLEELTKICQCMEHNNRILPLFYHVDPSDVRKRGGRFEEAFIKHEKDGKDREKLKQWSDALTQVANFTGWNTRDFRTERELLNNIVKVVCSKVKPIGIEFTYGEKKIRLPRFVVLKAKYNSKYLSLTINDPALPGFIKFDGKDALSPLAKFEVEMAKSGNRLVHIRCCHNNKYLVRSQTSRWIVAAADKLDEDEYKISCTLFELEPVDKSRGHDFRFRHIQLGMYACLWRAEKPFFGGLYGGSNAPDKDECDVYTFFDGESANKTNKAVELPRFVALKAMYSEKYLSLTKNDPALPTGFIKFDENEPMSPQAKFEVEMAKSGNRLVHIRCCYNNKYLVRSGTSYWIVAAADKPEEDESKTSCTLFEPEPYDESGGQHFRFRHVQLGMYACLWRAKIPFFGGLYGGSNAPDIDACDVYIVVSIENH